MTTAQENIISRIAKKWAKPAIFMVAMTFPAANFMSQPPETTEDFHQSPRSLTTQQITDVNTGLFQPYLQQLNYTPIAGDEKQDQCAQEAYKPWTGLDRIVEKGGPAGALFHDFLMQANIQICYQDGTLPPEPLSTQHRIITIPNDLSSFQEEAEVVFANLFHAVQTGAAQHDIKSIPQLEDYMLKQNAGIILMLEIAEQMRDNDDSAYWRHLSTIYPAQTYTYMRRLEDHDLTDVNYAEAFYKTRAGLMQTKTFDHSAAFNNFALNDFKQTHDALNKEPSFLAQFIFGEKPSHHIEKRGLIKDSEAIQSYLNAEYDGDLRHEIDFLDYQAIAASEMLAAEEYQTTIAEIKSKKYGYYNLRPDHLAHDLAAEDKHKDDDFSRVISAVYQEYYRPRVYYARPDEETLAERGCVKPSDITYAAQSMIKAPLNDASISYTIQDVFNAVNGKTGVITDIAQAYMQQDSLIYCIENEETLGQKVAGTYSSSEGIISFIDTTTELNDIEDTLVHEVLHYIQDRKGLLHYGDDWSIYDRQTALMSVESAAKSVGFLYNFEQSLQGKNMDFVNNIILKGSDAPIYEAIKDTYEQERAFDTPHKEALRIAGEAGIYAFAQSERLTKFYNKRVATSYIANLSKNALGFPIKKAENILSLVQESGAFAADFNMSADFELNSFPDYFMGDQETIDLFAYIDHFARTFDQSDKNTSHKPVLLDNPFSGIDLIAFHKEFKENHDADPYLLITEIKKYKESAHSAPALKNNSMKRSKITL